MKYKLLAIFSIWMYVLSYPGVDQITLYNSAIQHQRAGNDKSALESYQAAINGYPQFPEAHQNIALIYERLGYTDLCKYHHNQSITYAITNEFKASAIVNLVTIELRNPLFLSYAELQRYLDLLNDASVSSPLDANPVFTAGLVCVAMGKYFEALDYFQRALVVQPSHPLALLNIGNYYFKQGSYARAAEYYDKAVNSVDVADRHNLMLTLSNLGQSYRESGKLTDALATFCRSFRIALSLEARSDASTCDWNEWSETDSAVITSVNQYFAVSNMYAVQGTLSHWQHLELWEHLMASFLLSDEHMSTARIRGLEGVPLTQAVDPYTASLMRYAANAVDKISCSAVCQIRPREQYTASYVPILSIGQQTHVDQTPLLRQKRALRVGYLSYDWRDHPMGRLTSHLVTAHNVSRVDSVSYSYGPDDGSTVRRAVQSGSTHFIDLIGVHSPLEAADIIHAAHLDVLIDLTSHTFNGRIDIAALKPAPLVINYLGFAGTSGCSGFDYSMVDRVVVPPEYSSAFCERLLYLPYSYQANNMPLQVAPCAKSRTLCRRENMLISSLSLFDTVRDNYDQEYYYGDKTMWICSFNANKKFEPVSFGVWMQILQRVQSAVLILLDVPPETKSHIARAVSHYGISLLRIVFASRMLWQNHLQRVSDCDLMLDTFVYGAHTTTSDLLWMHVPILVLSGYGSQRMPSRVAASIVHSLNGASKTSNRWTSIMIVDSVREYEERAVYLLEHVAILRNLRKRLGSAVMTGPAFDRHLMQHNVERAYQAAHEVRLLFAQRNMTVLPHIIMSRDESVSSASLLTMRTEAQAMFKNAVSALQNESIDDKDTLCFRAINYSSFSTCVEELYDCVMGMDIAGTMVSSTSWSAVVSLSRRLMDVSQTKSENDRLQYLASLLLHKRDDSVGEEMTVVSNEIMSDSVENEVISVDSFLKDIAMISSAPTSYSDLSSSLQEQFRSLLKQNYSDALTIVMTAQMQLFDASRCPEEGILFMVVAPLFFRFTTWNEYIPNLQQHQLQVDTVANRYLDSVYAELRNRDGLFNISEIARSISWESLDDEEMFSLLFTEIVPRLLRSRSLLNNNLFFQNNVIIDEGVMNNDVIRHGLSHLLSTHSSCLLQQGGHTNSVAYVMTVLSELKLSFTYRSLRNMGVMLQDCGEAESGFLLSSVAILKMHHEQFQPHQALDRLVTRQGGGLRDHVVFYCNEYGQSWWPGWGPTSVSQQGRGGGMGGSEEAVYYVAMELIKLGYNVTIYADIPLLDNGVVTDADNSEETSGHILWLHLKHFDTSLPCDLFVAWRYALSLIMGRNARKSYLWLHDLVPGSILPTTLFQQVDGVLVQSEFHKKYVVTEFQTAHSEIFAKENNDAQLNNILEQHVYIVPNGILIDNQNVTVPTNKNHIFVYGSAPNRGLASVLNAWSSIREKLPNAQLEVYYGFTEAVRRHMTSQLGSEGYSQWISQMQTLLAQEGVSYYGAVDHDTLTRAYSRAGFLLYPTAFQETGCITALRAMVSGAIPITSRLVESVLFTLTNAFDLGPTRALNLSVATNEALFSEWLFNDWVAAVVSASTMDEDKLNTHRANMMRWTKLNYSWKNSALVMNELF